MHMVDPALYARIGQDRFDQGHEVRLGHELAQAFEQNEMIDRREVLADVGAQHIAIAARELLETVDGAMRAFADAIGVAIRNEHALEARLDDRAQGVVDDAVANTAALILRRFGSWMKKCV